jgi:purine-binding chemotaxis protein CheW
MNTVSVNWEQVRSRLRASEEALAEALRGGPQRIRIAYRQRAVRLAKTQASPTAFSPGLPVIIFRLARERYAIELKDLAEVLPFTRCTPVPGAPSQFLGVINLRGELRGVLDLSQLLALPESESTKSGFVLILRAGLGVGLKVDSVEELHEIRPEDLTRPMQANHLKGLASGTLPLLDVDILLADVFSKEGVLTT